MRSLPPFAELVAFEAVARHLSFTKAAAELCITQSAVSHRVQRLEKHFGTRLIERLNPGLSLTSAGSALLPQLAAMLDTMEKMGGKRERRLRVAASSSLCTWWLAGRLPDFMKRHPGLSVELIPVDNDASAVPEVDVRVLWVTDFDSSVPTHTPLFNEQVFPVCSPRLLPNGRPLRDPRALGALTLLHKSASASGEWSWSTWFERLGIDANANHGAALHLADMGLVLSAAVSGAGVALARSLLAYDALRAGTLVVPIAGFEPMMSVKKHVARWPRGRADDQGIVEFVDWLKAEAKTTLADIRELLLTSPPAIHLTAVRSG